MVKDMHRSLWLIAALFVLAAAVAQATTYKIDSAHTFPQFEIRHLAFSMIHGRFNHTTGTITMDRAENLGSVQVRIAVDSVDTGVDARDAHLQKPEFFDAGKYPYITYQSTRVDYTGEHTATVYGKLTMKGVTKPVELHVSRIHCAPDPLGEGERCGFDASAEIKRSNFGVSAYVPVIPDTVHIILNVEAVSVPDKQGG
ncbi:MAG: YceI family protein [Gammaproteobacteria bacterium]|nr:YceI family protein [Gammaproteobacteria bacterium]